MQALNIPLLGIGFGRHIGVDQLFDHFMAHIADDFRQVFGCHDFTTLTKDHLTLVIHHIVKFEHVLTHVKVTTFDLGLGAFQRFVHPGVNDRFAFLHAKARQNLIQPLRAKDPHQIVFETEIETGAPRIPLATRTAAQLIVDPAAFVTFRGHHTKATRLENLFLFFGVLGFFLGPQSDRIRIRVGLKRRHHDHIDIAAQLNISPPARHIGGDGYRVEPTRIRNDLGFLLVVTGVQHVMFDALFLQHHAQQFGLLD